MVEMNKAAQETAEKQKSGWVRLREKVNGHLVVDRGRSHCITGLVNRCKHFVFYLGKSHLQVLDEE